MKTLHISIAILLFTMAAGVSTYGQKTRSKRPVPRPTPTKTTVVKNSATLPPLDVRAARVKVSNQVSNVDRFISVMGPIAQSIEALDSEARSRKV